MRKNLRECYEVCPCEKCRSGVPLHSAGPPAILHARGRESARVRLMGSWTGTLAVIRRQAQSTLVLRIVCNELQQPVVGDDDDEPLPILPVIKLKHGVKLLIIDNVHGVLICPLTNVAEITKRVANNIAVSREPLAGSMRSCSSVYVCMEKWV